MKYAWLLVFCVGCHDDSAYWKNKYYDEVKWHEKTREDWKESQEANQRVFKRYRDAIRLQEQRHLERMRPYPEPLRVRPYTPYTPYRLNHACSL